MCRNLFRIEHWKPNRPKKYKKYYIYPYQRTKDSVRNDVLVGKGRDLKGVLQKAWDMKGICNPETLYSITCTGTTLSKRFLQVKIKVNLQKLNKINNLPFSPCCKHFNLDHFHYILFTTTEPTTKKYGIKKLHTTFPEGRATGSVRWMPR